MNLGYMDIYVDQLDDAYTLAESILKDYGYTEEDLFEYFNQDMEEQNLNNLSNRIVGIIFRIVEDLIHKKKPEEEVSYYINGNLDTHFYINGEQQ